MSDSFRHATYQVRRKVFKIFGGAFHIFDPSGNVAFFSEMKAFKLKEDIRIFTDESKSNEVLVIKSRQILDFGATYDVFDPVANEAVGALRRKGLKSTFLKDEWVILNASGQEIGFVKEDNLFKALVRRLLTNLIPQTYYGEIDGQHVCTFKQNFNPFVMKINLDFTPDLNGLLDRRLGIAAAILLCAIEGKQN